MISGRTNAVTAEVGSTFESTGVAADPAANTVYLTQLGPALVPVVSGTTDSVTATIGPVGLWPDSVAVNPVTSIGYTTDWLADAVSVFSERTRKVTATIRVGRGPDALAVNPATNLIYAASLGPETGRGTVWVTVAGDERPRRRPGLDDQPVLRNRLVLHGPRRPARLLPVERQDTQPLKQPRAIHSSARSEPRKILYPPVRGKISVELTLDPRSGPPPEADDVDQDAERGAARRRTASAPPRRALIVVHMCAGSAAGLAAPMAWPTQHRVRWRAARR